MRRTGFHSIAWHLANTSPTNSSIRANRKRLADAAGAIKGSATSSTTWNGNDVLTSRLGSFRISVSFLAVRKRDPRDLELDGVKADLLHVAKRRLALADL